MSTADNDRAPDRQLPRRKPAPLPAIHPLPEYLAEGARKASYEDTKAVLQVPWMGVVTMAFAHYPRFYATLWEGLRPLYVSAPLVAACARLRARAEMVTQSLSPPPIAPRLATLGYAPREIPRIAEMLEIFSYGNMPYLLLATQSRLLLEGHALSSETAAEPFSGRHGPDASVPFVLMEPHHADQATRVVYDDVKTTLGLPFVNTDYRALARWPSYFAAAWGDLRGHIATAAYEEITTEIHDTAVGIASALPNPGGLTPEALQAAASAEASLGEITDVVRLFQWLLPGLVANIAFFRVQLVAEKT